MSSRWRSTSAARTSGRAATSDARALTSRRADRALTSSPSSVTPLAEPDRARQRVGRAAQLGERDAAVHRAGVEVREAERVGDGARDGGLAGARGPVDGDQHAAEHRRRPLPRQCETPRPRLDPQASRGRADVSPCSEREHGARLAGPASGDRVGHAAVDGSRRVARARQPAADPVAEIVVPPRLAVALPRRPRSSCERDAAGWPSASRRRRSCSAGTAASRAGRCRR